MCHKLNGMTLRMDKAGRVVLLKALRDRLGLREGSDLEVEETAEGIVLKPLEDRPGMIKREGLWVYTGRVPPGFDAVQAIRDEREERIRKTSGL